MFDDHQSDNLTVLNAHFDIDPTKPEYGQISHFEIKVPALVMKKSAPTAVFLHTDEKSYNYGTILKSWIKDANTIACACLFLVPPPGEISNSAISIVSEMLVLTGAILGVKTSYDIKFHKFEAELRNKADKEESLQ